MASQNILNYYGNKLDIKVDYSELYDYEITKTNLDYDPNVIIFNNNIAYTSLTINSSLSNMGCKKKTITITDGTNNFVLKYNDFISFYETNYNPNYGQIILNNDIFYGIDGEKTYTISDYNNLNIINSSWIRNNLSGLVLQCEKTSDCCSLPLHLNCKPWVYKFNNGNCTPIIQRRTEKGWTLDFIFNRQNNDWINNSVFYYIGVRGSNDLPSYADNNLSFQFTSDGCIKWVAVRYSGNCNPTVGYSESYYIESGMTPTLCTIDPIKDFNVTITFDRNIRLTDCNLPNDGGYNDLIPEFIINSITPTGKSTSTQYVTHNTSEILNKKWEHEKERRMGTLKIYLNGNPIYKLTEWEEVIPSNRGVQPFIQSWGGGTGLMGGVHDGICCFNIKSIQYYEEPLDFVHIKHNFIMKKNQYDFFICGENCIDNIWGFEIGNLLKETSENVINDNNDEILYRI